MIKERRKREEEKPDIQEMQDFSVKGNGARQETSSAWKEIGRILK